MHTAKIKWRGGGEPEHKTKYFPNEMSWLKCIYKKDAEKNDNSNNNIAKL